MKQIFTKTLGVGALLLGCSLASNAESITLSSSNSTFSGTLQRSTVYEFKIEDAGKVIIKGEGSSSYNSGVPQYILYSSSNTVYDNGVDASSQDFDYADYDNDIPAYREWIFDNGTLEVNKTYYLAFTDVISAPATANFTITLEAAGGGNADGGIILSNSNPTFSGTITKGKAYEFKIEDAGQVVIKGEGTTSFASGVPQFILYSSDNTVYDNGVEASSTEYDWEDTDLGIPAYREWTFNEGTLEVGKVYYLAYTYDYAPATANFTITLGDNSGSGEIVPDIELTLGEPTLIKKGQKAYFNPPVGADNGTHAIVIATNSTTLIPGKFVYDNYGVSDYAPTAELTETGYVYTQGGEAMGWAPFYILQNTLDEVTITVTIPDFADNVNTITEVELNEEFPATQNQMYSFQITEVPFLLGVKTSLKLDYTNEYRSMIYPNKDRTDRIDAVNKEPIEDNGMYVYSYLIEKAGTYYFNCKATGTYELIQLEIELEGEPFEAAGSLVSPLPGESAIYQFVVTWQQTVLDPDKSLFLGAKITNPKGLELNTRLIDLTSATEAGTALDAVGLYLAYSDYDNAKVIGDYTVYLPQGFCVDIEGNPSPETTLVYTLYPEASSDDEFEYFPNSTQVSDNIPADYYLNSIENYILTYPFELAYVGEGTNVKVTVNSTEVYAQIAENTLIVPVNLSAGTENLPVNVTFTENLFCKADNELLVNPPATYQFILYGANQVATFDPETNYTFYQDTDANNMLVNVSWTLPEGTMILPNLPTPEDENEDVTVLSTGISLKDSEGNEVELEYYVNFIDNDELNGYIFDLSNLEVGTYTITIPQGCLSFLTVKGNNFENVEVEVAGLNALAVASFIIKETKEDNDNGDDDGDDDGDGDDNGDDNGGDNGDDNGGDNGDDNGGDNGDDNGGDNGDDNGGDNGDDNGGDNGDDNGGDNTPDDPGTSSIEALKADPNVVIYNINGLRVNNRTLQPGLYIINGKKIVVR